MREIFTLGVKGRESMDRRAVLLRIGATVSVTGIAGCVDAVFGGDDDELTPPPDSASTRELLPVATDGWERTAVRVKSAETIGAERGHNGVYDSPGGRRYEADVVLWDSQSAAEDSLDGLYADWATGLTLGKFSFAADGVDEELARSLLSKSSALTNEYVEEHSR